jgi:hypothetical protein
MSTVSPVTVRRADRIAFAVFLIPAIALLFAAIRFAGVSFGWSVVVFVPLTTLVLFGAEQKIRNAERHAAPEGAFGIVFQGAGTVGAVVATFAGAAGTFSFETVHEWLIRTSLLVMGIHSLLYLLHARLLRRERDEAKDTDDR